MNAIESHTVLELILNANPKSMKAQIHSVKWRIQTRRITAIPQNDVLRSEFD